MEEAKTENHGGGAAGCGDPPRVRAWWFPSRTMSPALAADAPAVVAGHAAGDTMGREEHGRVEEHEVRRRYSSACWALTAGLSDLWG